MTTGAMIPDHTYWKLDCALSRLHRARRTRNPQLAEFERALSQHRLQSRCQRILWRRHHRLVFVVGAKVAEGIVPSGQ